MATVRIGSAGPNDEVVWTVELDAQNRVMSLTCVNNSAFDAYGAIRDPVTGTIKLDGVFHPGTTTINVPVGQRNNFQATFDASSGQWDFGDRIIQWPYVP